MAREKRDPRSALARDTLQAARNLAADERWRRLPHGQGLFLLVGFIKHADTNLAIWPGIELWAEEAGVSERTAKEALAAMREQVLDLLDTPLLTVKKVKGKRVYQFDPALKTAHLRQNGADPASQKGKSRTSAVQDLPRDGADLAPVPNGVKERGQENEEQERETVDDDLDEDFAFALSDFKLRGKALEAAVRAHDDNPAGLAKAMVIAAKKDNPAAYLTALIRKGFHKQPATTSFAQVRYAITGRDPLDDLPECERCGFWPYSPGVLREVTVRREGKPIVATVCDECERELKEKGSEM
jgi:hypothetical protein